jgi:hypothetical protein
VEARIAFGEKSSRYLQLKAECRAFNAASAARHGGVTAAMKALLREQVKDVRNERRRH